MKSFDEVTAFNSSLVNALAGKFLVVVIWELDRSGPSTTSSLVALSSSSISLRRFCRSSSSLSRSLRLSRLFALGVETGDGPFSLSDSESARDRPRWGGPSSVVCPPLLYEKTSLTGDGGNS